MLLLVGRDIFCFHPHIILLVLTPVKKRERKCYVPQIFLETLAQSSDILLFLRII